MDNREVQERFLKAMHRFGRMNMTLDILVDGMTKGEFFCLSMLSDYQKRHPDSVGMYVWEMARHMRASPPAASRMLRGLEVKGLVERRVDRMDRRNTYIVITPQGAEEWGREARRVQDFMDRVVGRMGREDMDALVTLWDRLNDIVEDEQAKETGAC